MTRIKFMYAGLMLMAVVIHIIISKVFKIGMDITPVLVGIGFLGLYQMIQDAVKELNK